MANDSSAEDELGIIGKIILLIIGLLLVGYGIQMLGNELGLLMITPF